MTTENTEESNLDSTIDSDPDLGPEESPSKQKDSMNVDSIDDDETQDEDKENNKSKSNGSSSSRKRKSSPNEDTDNDISPPRKKQKTHNEATHKLKIKIINDSREFDVKSLQKIPYFKQDKNKINCDKDGGKTKYSFKSGSTTLKFSGVQFNLHDFENMITYLNDDKKYEHMTDLGALGGFITCCDKFGVKLKLETLYKEFMKMGDEDTDIEKWKTSKCKLLKELYKKITDDGDDEEKENEMDDEDDTEKEEKEKKKRKKGLSRRRTKRKKTEDDLVPDDDDDDEDEEEEEESDDEDDDGDTNMDKNKNKKRRKRNKKEKKKRRVKTEEEKEEERKKRKQRAKKMARELEKSIMPHMRLDNNGNYDSSDDDVDVDNINSSKHSKRLKDAKMALMTQQYDDGDDEDKDNQDDDGDMIGIGDDDDDEAAAKRKVKSESGYKSLYDVKYKDIESLQTKTLRRLCKYHRIEVHTEAAIKRKEKFDKKRQKENKDKNKNKSKKKQEKFEYDENDYLEDDILIEELQDLKQIENEEKYKKVDDVENIEKIGDLHTKTLRRLARNHDFAIHTEKTRRKIEKLNEENEDKKKKEKKRFDYKNDAEYVKNRTLIKQLKELKEIKCSEDNIKSLTDIDHSDDIGDLQKETIKRLCKMYHVKLNQSIQKLIEDLEDKWQKIQDGEENEYSHIKTLKDVENIEDIKTFDKETIITLSEAHGLIEKPKEDKDKDKNKNKKKKKRDIPPTKELKKELEDIMKKMIKKRKERQDRKVDKLEQVQQDAVRLKFRSNLMTISGDSKRNKRKRSNDDDGFSKDMGFKEDVMGLVALCNSVSTTKGNGWDVVDKDLDDYSVVVSESGARTIKVMLCVARGGSVVTKKWINHSIKKKQWLNPQNYEDHWDNWYKAATESRDARIRKPQSLNDLWHKDDVQSIKGGALNTFCEKHNIQTYEMVTDDEGNDDDDDGKKKKKKYKRRNLTADEKRGLLEEVWDETIGDDENEGKLMGELLQDYTIYVQDRGDVCQPPASPIKHIAYAAGAHVVDENWKRESMKKSKKKKKGDDDDNEETESEKEEEEEEEEEDQSDNSDDEDYDMDDDKNKNKNKNKKTKIRASRRRRGNDKNKNKNNSKEEADDDDEDAPKKNKRNPKAPRKNVVIISHPGLISELNLKQMQKDLDKLRKDKDDGGKIKVVNVKWLFDSIEAYKVVGFDKKYIVKKSKRHSKSPTH